MQRELLYVSIYIYIDTDINHILVDDLINY